jgi:hypothetical protein
MARLDRVDPANVQKEGLRASPARLAAHDTSGGELP